MHLGHDELLEVDVIRQRHPPRVNAEDAPLGLGVGQRELDLAINAPGTDQGRVQRLDAVGGHDDLPDWGSRASYPQGWLIGTRGESEGRYIKQRTGAPFWLVYQHSFSCCELSPPLPHLDLAHGVEAVELVEKLKHGPLNLTLAAAVRVVTLGPDRVDLV